MMRRRFVTLDVFTHTRFAGNPLAVVRDADGLDTAGMQAIAREFNLSETVFLLPAGGPSHRARLRIFTPARELPFAGHPTIGTAALLGIGDGPGEHSFVLGERIGPLRCVVTVEDEAAATANFDIPQLPGEIGTAPDPAAMAQALGLEPSDLELAGFAPAIYSAGVPFAFVPVTGLAAIRRCKPDAGLLAAALGDAGPHAVFVFCRETEDPAYSFHARMFAPAFGIAEDPATGSAVAAFAGVLAAFDPHGNGQRRVAIEQGYEMGRPSQIGLALTTLGGRLQRVTISGAAIIVSSGTIEA
jgi:trans-2,3-dihydro-3-hydroxyanthranilate isomerase